jgi:two-component system response regulator QseB
MRILLVEDDYQLGDSLQAALKLENYAVDWERDGEQVAAMVNMGDYDLMILDLGLPKVTGLEVLQQLRAANDSLPVLILSAKDSTDDKVLGLNTGADDYLTKPFDISELCARIRSLIRRRQEYVQPVFEVGGVELDPNQRTVSRGGELLEMTGKEFALLEMLMLNQGKFVSKNRLLEGLYSWDQDVESNILEVYISRLRKQLGKEFIETFRGMGYRVGGKGTVS